MKALSALIGLVYPFAIFLGLQWLSPRALALVIGLILLVRVVIRLRGRAWQHLAPLLRAAGLVGGLVGLAALFDDGRYFKLLPVMVNAGLCLAFARSLAHGPSMVETLARLHYSRVPDDHLPYCHRVTLVWSVFFALNALFILWLAAAASLEAWMLYTGLIAYLLAGALFVTEAVYRAWRFRHYEDGPGDAILRRIFPPRVGA